MTEEKILGKIDYAEFGTYPERPFLFGLQLGFAMEGSGVMDGGKYTVNISPECKWSSEKERENAINRMIEITEKTLTDAGVNYVSELVGKPVEITIDGYQFKDFRILKEVI